MACWNSQIFASSTRKRNSSDLFLQTWLIFLFTFLVSWNELVASGKIETSSDSNMTVDAEKAIKETNENTSSLESDLNTNEQREGMLVKGENFRSIEGGKPEKDRASNENQIVVNDGSKKVITLEEMRREVGQTEAAENKPTEGQLVTFKVTVRNAQDRTAIRKGDQVTDVPNGARDGANGLKEGGKVVSDATKEASGGSTEVTEAKKELLDTKATEVKSLPIKRKKRGMNTPEGKTSNDGGQVRKRKRTSLGTDAAEKGKRKVAGGKSGDKDIPGEKREKRSRTAFSNERKMILEGYFEKSIYVSKKVVEEISKELGIDKKRIENWFRNRRSKLKKDEEGKLKNNDENLSSKKESVEKLDAEKEKEGTEKGDSEERNSPDVDSSSGLSSEEGSTIENSPVNVTETSQGFSSVDVKSERRNIDGTSGLAEKSSLVISTESSDRLKNENEKKFDMMERKASNLKMTEEATEITSVSSTSNRFVRESETKPDLNRDVISDISATAFVSESRIDEPHSDQMIFKQTKSEETELEPIAMKQLDRSTESPLSQAVLAKHQEKVGEGAECRPSDRTENFDEQYSMDEKITRPVPNRPQGIDLVDRQGKDQTSDDETEKHSDQPMKTKVEECSDIYNGMNENLNAQLSTAAKINGVISRDEKQHRINERFSDNASDSVACTKELRIDEKENRTYENRAEYYSETPTNANSLKAYEKHNRVYENTSDYPSNHMTYSRTDEYRERAHDYHGEEFQYTNVGYEDVSCEPEKSRDSIVVRSPEIKTPIFFPPTPTWEDIPVFKNSKQSGPYSIISPELSRSYSGEVGIDGDEESSASIRPRIWSSEEEQATYALTEIENYEMEEDDVESKVQEDLAIALNNDPDFIKDLNELMDIAKT